jgi:hypothetical protein
MPTGLPEIDVDRVPASNHADRKGQNFDIVGTKDELGTRASEEHPYPKPREAPGT